MAKTYSNVDPRVTITSPEYPHSSGFGPYNNPFPTSGSYAGYLPSSDSVPDLIERWDRALEEKDDQELAAEEWQALKAEYLKHLTWRFAYPQTVFRQQIATAWAVTVLVFLLVLVGLGFSIYQLIWAMKLGDLTSLHTEVAVQTAGRLSISSSVVGVVVLLVSLAFFYLFIRHVFGVRQPLPPHVGLREIDAAMMERKGPKGGSEPPQPESTE